MQGSSAATCLTVILKYLGWFNKDSAACGVARHARTTPATKTEGGGKESNLVLMKGVWQHPLENCFTDPGGEHHCPSYTLVPSWLSEAGDLAAPSVDKKKWVLLKSTASSWARALGHSHCTTAVCEPLRAHGAVVAGVLQATWMKVFLFSPFTSGVRKPTS